MEKEVNQEIRTKIIQLIHKELDNVEGENIFKSCRQWFENPVNNFQITTKYNVDVSTVENSKSLYYTLVFEDGEPSISISTSCDFAETKEPYKTVWTWRGRRKLFTTHRKYTVVTYIRCGHISFELTEEEHQDLINKTELAWNKYLSLKDITLDNKVLDKINLRLEE